MQNESLGSEVAALAARAKHLEERLAAYTEAFARAQRTLLDAAEFIRVLKVYTSPAEVSRSRIATMIDACSLAAMNPGVVKHGEPELDTMPWSVGAGRLSVELHALTDLLALARAIGCEVGSFNVHELARIAGDLHAASYVEHSIALNKIHALMHNMPAPTGPMTTGAEASIATTVERVQILVGVLRKATDALVAGASPVNVTSPVAAGVTNRLKQEIEYCERRVAETKDFASRRFEHEDAVEMLAVLRRIQGGGAA